MVDGKFPLAHPSDKLIRASDMWISSNLYISEVEGRMGWTWWWFSPDLRAMESKLLQQ
jgi:hypothetical protein